MALPHSLNILDYPARFQFGQAGAPCNGQSCCTDTCIQMIVEYYKERTYTLSQVRTAAQAKTSFDERPCTGINYIEVLNALNALGVTHYKAGFGSTWSDVWQYLDYGPVLVGTHYGSYPNAANGKCGTTNRAEISGKTDCTFTGAHAVLAVGKRYHTVNGVTHKDFLVRDPDHASAARPEKPNFDRMTAGQLSRTMVNLPKYTPFTNTYIIYPTRKKVL